MSVSVRRLVSVGLFGLCAACGPKEAPNFNSTDITGAHFGQDAHWIDQSGHAVELANYKGKVVALFFGFTQCPDVCPTTMAQLKEVKKQLGPQGDQLQVVLMTIDPAHDTPAVLGQYVKAFDPSFVGVSASEQETKRILENFKAFAEKVKGKDGKTYSFDHTAAIYLYDPQGNLRLFVRPQEKNEKVVADIKALLKPKAAG